MNKKLEEISIKLRDKFSEFILDESSFREDLSFVIKPDSLYNFLKFSKEYLGFESLIDITSIDFPDQELRFEMVYHLYSFEELEYLRIAVKIKESEMVDSVMDLWSSANWQEREIFDMMGIKFKNHSNLKRILMWEGYPYHPLLKNFPLEGMESNSKDIAFSDIAPLEGGPFISNSGNTRAEREPSSKKAD